MKGNEEQQLPEGRKIKKEAQLLALGDVVRKVPKELWIGGNEGKRRYDRELCQP